MGSQVINFADVDSFEPLPGNEWYDVEIDKVEVRENKAGDANYLNWEFIILDGEYENRRLWMITSLKSNALFRLKDVFENLELLEDNEEMELEWDDDVEITSKSGPLLLWPEVEGLEAVVYVKNEMYDGRETNRVQEVRGERPKGTKKSRRKVDSDNQQVAKSRRSSKRYEEDEEEEEPRRSRRRRNTSDEPSTKRSRSRSREEEYDEEDDDEENEAPRRSRTSSKSSSSRSGKTRRRRMR